MMDAAELFGGVAAMVLMHRTDLEKATDDMLSGLASMSSRQIAVENRLEKLLRDDLRKSFSLKSVLADLQNLKNDVDTMNADMAKLHEIADRQRAALPSFAAWLRNEPYPATAPTGVIRDIGSGLPVVGKSADSYGDLGDALAAGEIQPLRTGQPPIIDPTADVADAMLARRFQRD